MVELRTGTSKLPVRRPSSPLKSLHRRSRPSRPSGIMAASLLRKQTADSRTAVKNPWLKKNPFMSMWLSGAHKVAGAARGLAVAAVKREATQASKDIAAEGIKQVLDFRGAAAGAAAPKPKARPMPKVKARARKRR